MASISPAQSLAVAALSSGSSVTAAAQAAGVARETVSRWAHHNPAFIAELQNARAEIAAQTRCALEALGMRSVATLNEALQAVFMPPTRVRAACAVLKMLGADRAETLAPTTPLEVKLRLRDREKKIRELQETLDPKDDAATPPADVTPVTDSTSVLRETAENETETPHSDARPGAAAMVDDASRPLASEPVPAERGELAEEAPLSREKDEPIETVTQHDAEREADPVSEWAAFARDLVDHIHSQGSGAGQPEGRMANSYSLTAQLRDMVNNGPRPAPPIPPDISVLRSRPRRHTQARSKGGSQ
jgi:hypothetical protein